MWGARQLGEWVDVVARDHSVPVAEPIPRMIPGYKVAVEKIQFKDVRLWQSGESNSIVLTPFSQPQPLSAPPCHHPEFYHIGNP